VIFMPINVQQRGDWSASKRFLEKMNAADVFSSLEQFGAAGVAALAAATPAESGITGQSWYYEIVQRRGYYSIRWRNSNVVDGRPIAILLQYGHGTRQGGYVEGRDYIMPAIRPVFDQIDAELRKVVMAS
jgi:hypothetical protein